MVYAILLSGGIGTRTGFNMPKQFIEVNEKPFLAYCIDKFIEINEFKKIIVSSPKEYISKTEKLIEKYFPNENRLIVIEGGKTRQDTLMNSIRYVNKINNNENSYIINHDAARIFVPVQQIKKCIEFTKKYGASSPVIPSTDVIVETGNNQVIRMPNRYNMVHVQTPQGFKLNEYIKLYNKLTLDEKESVH